MGTVGVGGGSAAAGRMQRVGEGLGAGIVWALVLVVGAGSAGERVQPATKETARA